MFCENYNHQVFIGKDADNNINKVEIILYGTILGDLTKRLNSDQIKEFLSSSIEERIKIIIKNICCVPGETITVYYPDESMVSICRLGHGINCYIRKPDRVPYYDEHLLKISDVDGVLINMLRVDSAMDII